MRTTTIALIALSAAACDSGPTVSADNASVSEVANKVAAAGAGDSFVRPGEWESTMTFEKVEAPDMPPQAREMMQAMLGRTQSARSCLTQAEVEKPSEDFFASGNENCRYETFRMGGGKIDAVMNCTAEGATQKMAMTGTYSPDSYTMRMETTSSGGGPMAGMTMVMKVDSKRIGECRGGEAAADR